MLLAALFALEIFMLNVVENDASEDFAVLASSENVTIKSIIHEM